MTMEVPAVGPFNAEIRNCSSRSLFCDKGSDLNCKCIFLPTLSRSVLLSSLLPIPLPFPRLPLPLPIPLALQKKLIQAFASTKGSFNK